MKFSIRVAGVIILGVSLIVVYFTWGDDLITWSGNHDNPRHTAHKTTHPHRQSRPKSSNTRDSISNLGQCLAPEKYHAKTDFNTVKIIHYVDAELAKQQKDKDDGDGHNRRRERVDSHFTAPKTSKPDKVKKLPLHVILVPHSHSDPGWHKTVDGYFFDQTRPTLDNMVEKLLKYPNMTFIWAESVFLSMWWDDLGSDMKHKVQKVIDSGQLEIVVGSWVVPDEANPHYFGIIDQMIEGHQWLEKNMGYKPKNTWSLDPFGYSSTLPFLYKEAGFDNMIVLRVHVKVKEQLQINRALEFNWRQHWDASGETDIFTQMMPYRLYNIKHTCGPDHNICLQFDFRDIPGEYSEAQSEPITNANVDRLSKVLLGQYEKKANLFKHRVLLVPLGDDFRYDRNVEWDQQYKNYMKLFNHMNKQEHMNVYARFGTLQDYFDQVKKTVSENPDLFEFPTLQGDLFPYTDQNDEYWAGYFTTRPYDKNMGRELEVNIRAAEILHSLALASAKKEKALYGPSKDNWDRLTTGRQALGLFQHHDAITGTAKAYVVKDYEARLDKGMDAVRQVITTATNFLLREDKSVPINLDFDLDEINSLKPLDPTKFKVNMFTGEANIVLFNSASHPREELVHFTINNDNVEVYNENGKVIFNQINPIWPGANEVSMDDFELVFIATVPALAMVTYNIKALPPKSRSKNNAIATFALYNMNGQISRKSKFLQQSADLTGVVLETSQIIAKFSPSDGTLQSVKNKLDSTVTDVKLEFLMYDTMMSGAYIFRPQGPATKHEFLDNPPFRVLMGPLVSEVQILHSTIKHTTRLVNSSGLLGSVLEINNIVDIRTEDNKEMVMRFTSDVKQNNGTFYTDLNGLHVMKRKRFQALPLEANFYPMSAFAYVENIEKRLSVISGQPLGVSSLADGALEVMLDRKLAFDDQRGLGEGVRDNKVTPSRFYLHIEKRLSPDSYINDKTMDTISSFPSLASHSLADQLRHHVFKFVINSQKGSISHIPFLRKFEPVSSPLPCDVTLVNLRSLTEGGSDVREQTTQSVESALILHKIGYDCAFSSQNVQCAKKSTITLKDLFTGVEVDSVKEMSLSLMHEKSKVNIDKSLQLKSMHLYTYKVKFG